MACVTGDETGIVKVWDISRSGTSRQLLSLGEQTRKRGVAAMCWATSSTSSIYVSKNDGSISYLNLEDLSDVHAAAATLTAATGNALSVVRNKVVCVSKENKIGFLSTSLEDLQTVDCEGPVDAVHIHRRYGLAAIGGKENDLHVYDVIGERPEEPVFIAKNVADHILDVPFPIFVTGTCVVNPFVFCTTTAYHDVRFYDRRASGRPVQEFSIGREIDRRPTTLMQWNCNKYLIGEASGDVHLYDTRRGFTSRAKLRGGVGSVRSLAKHPAGHQILAAAGLDRKVRIYHVPTGKLLMSTYTKQKLTSVLLDKKMPMADNTASFSSISNTKQAAKASTLGDDVWDNMDPVTDDIIYDDAAAVSGEKSAPATASKTSAPKKRSRTESTTK